MGRARILRLLLAAGADANALDDSRSTPLHFAAELGHARAAQVLLDMGADPLRCNAFGSTPLDKTEVQVWDAADVARGKSEIRRLLTGEHLATENLRPEPAIAASFCRA